MQRLDRFLSEAGVASRRELRAIIRAGRVRVNDERKPLEFYNSKGFSWWRLLDSNQ